MNKLRGILCSTIRDFALLSHCFCKKLRFSYILQNFLFGIWIWAVENFRSSHHASLVRGSTVSSTNGSSAHPSLADGDKIYGSFLSLFQQKILPTLIDLISDISLLLIFYVKCFIIIQIHHCKELFV